MRSIKQYVVLSAFVLTTLLAPSESRADGANQLADLPIVMAAMLEVLIPDLRYRFGSEVNDEVMVTWPLELGLMSAGTDDLGFVLSIMSDLQVGVQTEEVNFSPGLRGSLGYDRMGVVAEGGTILGPGAGWWTGGGLAVKDYPDMEEREFYLFWGVSGLYRYVSLEGNEWHEITLDVSFIWMLTPH